MKVLNSYKTSKGNSEIGLKNSKRHNRNQKTGGKLKC